MLLVLRIIKPNKNKPKKEIFVKKVPITAEKRPTTKIKITQVRGKRFEIVYQISENINELINTTT